jgi:hypothetical protein
VILRADQVIFALDASNGPLNMNLVMEQGARPTGETWVIFQCQSSTNSPRAEPLTHSKTLELLTDAILCDWRCFRLNRTVLERIQKQGIAWNQCILIWTSQLTPLADFEVPHHGAWPELGPQVIKGVATRTLQEKGWHACSRALSCTVR